MPRVSRPASACLESMVAADMLQASHASHASSLFSRRPCRAQERMPACRLRPRQQLESVQRIPGKRESVYEGKTQNIVSDYAMSGGLSSVEVLAGCGDRRAGRSKPPSHPSACRDPVPLCSQAQISRRHMRVIDLVTSVVGEESASKT